MAWGVGPHRATQRQREVSMTEPVMASAGEVDRLERLIQQVAQCVRPVPDGGNRHVLFEPTVGWSALLRRVRPTSVRRSLRSRIRTTVPPRPSAGRLGMTHLGRTTSTTTRRTNSLRSWPIVWQRPSRLSPPLATAVGVAQLEGAGFLKDDPAADIDGVVRTWSSQDLRSLALHDVQRTA